MLCLKQDVCLFNCACQEVRDVCIQENCWTCSDFDQLATILTASMQDWKHAMHFVCLVMSCLNSKRHKDDANLHLLNTAMVARPSTKDSWPELGGKNLPASLGHCAHHGAKHFFDVDLIDLPGGNKTFKTKTKYR